MSGLISVIVPIYNSAKTLHRCVDSILHQTYLNFELILINDGSSDNSGVICDKYVQKDSRVRVFHKENGGVSSARNLGIEEATGDFITFIDSDDWVDSNYLEEFMPFDNIDFASNYYVAEGWPEWVSCPFERKEYNKDNINEFFSSEFTSMNLICSKLFKKEIIDRYNIRFDNRISYGEDTLFVYSVLSHVNNVRIKGNPVYHYDCQGSGSLSLTPTPWYKYEHSINALCGIINEIEERYLWDGYNAINIVVKNHFNRCFRAIQADYSIVSGIRELKQSMQNKYVQQQVRDNRTYKKSNARRVLDWLLIHRMYFTCVLLMKLTYADKKCWFQGKKKII